MMGRRASVDSNAALPSQIGVRVLEKSDAGLLPSPFYKWCVVELYLKLASCIVRNPFTISDSEEVTDSVLPRQP